MVNKINYGDNKLFDILRKKFTGTTLHKKTVTFGGGDFRKQTYRSRPP